jgi:hypothetical protein
MRAINGEAQALEIVHTADGRSMALANQTG